MTLLPLAKSASRIDMTDAADVDKPALPGVGASLGECDIAVWIVGAGHHDAWTRQLVARYRGEALGLSRKACPVGIGDSYKQDTCNLD